MSESTPGSYAPDSSSSLIRPAWILMIIAWGLFLLPVPCVGPIGIVLNLAAIALGGVSMIKGQVGHGVALLLCGFLASPIVYFIGLAILGVFMAAAGAGGAR
jgi:hypothetical protein